MSLLIHSNGEAVHVAKVTYDTDYFIEKYVLADGEVKFKKVDFEELGTKDKLLELRLKIHDLEKLLEAYRKIQNAT